MKREAKYKRLKDEDRIVIEQMYEEEGYSMRAIARMLCVDVSTVSREIKRNREADQRYNALAASRKVEQRNCSNSFLSKIERSEKLQVFIEEQIKQYSPWAISARLKHEYGRSIISYESIYKYIYGPAHKKRLYRFLKRHKRYRGRRSSRKGKHQVIHNQRSIHERPDSARNEFGHWEADLIVFSMNRGAVLVLYERQSKFIFCKKLDQKSKQNTSNALIEILSTLPEKARKSITFDNGPEFTDHELLLPFLRDGTFFCDRYAAWQKGGIENVNGILRQHIPRGSHKDSFTNPDIQGIAHFVNLYPRKSLNARSAFEAFQSCIYDSPVHYPIFNSVALEF